MLDVSRTCRYSYLSACRNLTHESRFRSVYRGRELVRGISVQKHDEESVKYSSIKGENSRERQRAMAIRKEGTRREEHAVRTSHCSASDPTIFNTPVKSKAAGNIRVET